MANPLFKALSGGSDGPLNADGQTGAMPSNGASTPSNGPQMTMMDAMQQLRSDPAGTIRRAGYNVPDEIAGNPQATVMHLIQSGQIGGPMMQKIRPMLQMLGIGR